VLSVQQKINLLKNIFADFGIPVIANSTLDQAIHAEFGRGKHSKLTDLLNDLHLEPDCVKLAKHIGSELVNNTQEPELQRIGGVIQNYLPKLLQLVDIKQTTTKRELILIELLEHFKTKIPCTAQTDRLHRMLTAAHNNLHTNLQLQNFNDNVGSLGACCGIAELKASSNVLRHAMPALISLDQADVLLEQKVNYFLQALQALAVEFKSQKLNLAADILQDINWLAKITLPNLAEPATVEQSLQNLGITIGDASMRLLHEKIRLSGLTKHELAKIIYAGSTPIGLAPTDINLLQYTQETQRYASICAYLAKLARDINQPNLAKIGVIGISLASMRQLFYEFKTNNICAENFSEGLGNILLSAGIVANNQVLSYFGSSILAGVKAYAGIMAIPGGAAIAVPLAVCSSLTNLFIATEQKNTIEEKFNANQVMLQLLEQVLLMQRNMRQQFASLYERLQLNHEQLLLALDNSFSNLTTLVQKNNLQILTNLRKMDYKLDSFRQGLRKEFGDLYLLEVLNPLAEIDFAVKYGLLDRDKMAKTQTQLAMWLLFKSKNQKINGGDLLKENTAIADLLSYLNEILVQKNDHGTGLVVVNKYLNVNFQQQLPEALPHIPTWLLAAQAYIQISNMLKDNNTLLDEHGLAVDILAIGREIQQFIEQLASNTALWHAIMCAIQQLTNQIKNRWLTISLQADAQYLQDFESIYNSKLVNQSRMVAKSTAVSANLEPFEPLVVDITTLWNKYIISEIAPEFLMAESLGLGEFDVDFTVDKECNKFVDVHMPYSGNNILPEHARDVLFKLQVHFKLISDQQSYLLYTGWLAYDLRDSAQRFEQYYNRKFKYGLRHKKYCWLSLDGTINQVEGHPNTNTKKLIDYARLAEVYKNWLQNSLPVTHAELQQRVLHNPAFAPQREQLLAAKSFIHSHISNKTVLNTVLPIKLCEKIQQKRGAFASLLMEDQILKQLLDKLAVYYAIISIYGKILNLQVPDINLNQGFAELINSLATTEALSVNMLEKLQQFFALEIQFFMPDKQYLQGELYNKLSALLIKLDLLQTELSIPGYRCRPKI